MKGSTTNALPSGTNKVCAKCIWSCKQGAFAILDNCKSYQKDGPVSEGAPTVAEVLELDAADLAAAINKATNKKAILAIMEHESGRPRPRSRVILACRSRLDYICNWKEIPGV